MKKKLSLFLLIAMLSIFAAACGSSNDKAKEDANADKDAEKTETITVKHQLGEVEVKKNPKNVVVFDMGALDTLDKLGVEVAAVPHQGLPSYLSQYDSTVNAGGLKEPDFEAINEIAPELIIISGRQQDAYEELSKIGPTIYVGVDQANYVESFKENVTLLGQIFGKEAEVEKELAAIDESITALKESVPADKKGLIILTTGGKYTAYALNSRFGFIHEVFGVPAVDETIKSEAQHGQSISPEFIQDNNPDYLFVIDRDAVVSSGEGSQTAQETVETDIVKTTNAYKEGKIAYLDPNYWYLSGGGLESMAKMISDIQAVVK